MRYCWLLMLILPLQAAAGPATVESIPHAISGDGVYKVAIERIDGKPAASTRIHQLAPGKHKLELVLLLKIDFEPALEGFPGEDPAADA